MSDNIPLEIYLYDTLKRELETQFNIEILLMVESGSRMWGFASPDSDYDVRFIYRNRDLRNNITVGQYRDVIEYMPTVFGGLVDASGWDITKAVTMIGRGNGTMIDWLGSHIVYAQNEYAFSLLKLLQLKMLMYQPIHVRLLHHFRSTCSQSMKEGHNRCNGDLAKFPIKKFLYAIRCALMFQVINRVIPVGFYSFQDIPNPTLTEMVKGQSGSKREVIQKIVKLKSSLNEKTGTIDLTDEEYGEVLDLVEYVSGRKDIQASDRKVMVDTTYANAVLRACLTI